MKKLKLDHALAQEVVNGTRSAMLRVFDDKDLSVNDEVALIDKVDGQNPATWQPIGTAIINQIIEKRLVDVTPEEAAAYGPAHVQQSLLASLEEYYGSDVSEHTPVKLIRFSFSSKKPTLVLTDGVQKIEKAIIYADGGSRGNPGPSACGYAIYDGQKNLVVYRGVYLGVTTNNQAEYTGLKLALEEAKNLGAREVAVYMDSLLVINQMRGIFKVKNRDLWPIHEAARQLSERFKHVSFMQIPREMNKLADSAVNQTLDHQLNTVGSGATPGHF